MKQIVVLILGLASQAMATFWYEMSKIPLYTVDNFQSAIEKDKYTMVEFFSTRCPACEHARLEFERLYEWVQSKHIDSINFIRVNGLNDRDLIIKYQVPYYPHLLILRKGSTSPLAAFPNGMEKLFINFEAWVSQICRFDLLHQIPPVPATPAILDAATVSDSSSDQNKIGNQNIQIALTNLEAQTERNARNLQHLAKSLAQSGATAPVARTGLNAIQMIMAGLFGLTFGVVGSFLLRARKGIQEIKSKV